MLLLRAHGNSGRYGKSCDRHLPSRLEPGPSVTQDVQAGPQHAMAGDRGVGTCLKYSGWTDGRFETQTVLVRAPQRAYVSVHVSPAAAAGLEAAGQHERDLGRCAGWEGIRR